MKNNLHSEISKILDRDGLRTWAIKHGKNPEVVDIGVDKIITQILALIKKHERGVLDKMGLNKKCVIYLDHHNFTGRKCDDCGLKIDKKTEEKILANLKDPSGPKEVEK